MLADLSSGKRAKDFPPPASWPPLLPPGVVAIVNGRPVTKADILEAKRARQRRILANIRRPSSYQVKPCFVWVFYNESWIYGGWWVYVRTHKQRWQLSANDYVKRKLLEQVLAQWPCGLLPDVAFYRRWIERFAETYARATEKRPDKQGMAQGWAVVDSPRLLSVHRERGAADAELERIFRGWSRE